MTICTQCARENRPDAVRCIICGHRLKPSSPLGLPAFAWAIPLAVLLSVLSGLMGSHQFSGFPALPHTPSIQWPQGFLTPGGPAASNDSEDAVAQPDFGPYIADLQRRIRGNWNPPQADQNKRVVAMFKVDRQGNLTGAYIQQSSGSDQADKAALSAIRASAPFPALPAGFHGRDIDVQFIFDYEIYGKGRPPGSRQSPH
jgi:TonB family protein